MKEFLIYIFLYLISVSKSQNNTYQKLDNINRKSDINSGVDSDNSHLNLVNPLFRRFSEEWNRKMPDFHSQYIYSIPIKYKTKVDFYENITKVPCIFQGAYLYDEAKSIRDVIEFQIIAPNTSVIYRSSSIWSIFSLNLTHKGLYTISFNNKMINKEIRPIFIANSGQNLIIGKENLSETEKKLDSIISFLQQYDQDTKLMKGFKRRGNEELSSANNYFYAFSISETIVLIAVSIWQYFYLKHLFEIKGSL